jgi:hypothetical protein
MVLSSMLFEVFNFDARSGFGWPVFQAKNPEPGGVKQMPAWRRGTYDSGHCGLSWVAVGLVFIALVYTLDDVVLTG